MKPGPSCALRAIRYFQRKALATSADVEAALRPGVDNPAGFR
ncbi:MULTISPECIES: hypothetical protein [Oscillospiraceae]|nr:hypothetical protein [Oscillibacter sp. KLE 1728]